MQQYIESSKPFLILLAVNFVLRVSTLFQTVVNIDEPMYAQFAHSMFLGHAPYTTMIGEKPILLYLFYYAVLYLFGHFNLIAVHAAVIVWVTFTAVIVFLTIRRFAGERIAFSGAVIFSVLTTLGDFKMISSDGETLMNLPACVSTLFFLKAIESRRARDFLLAGLFIGVATHFRYQAGIQLAAAGMFLVVYKPFFSVGESGRIGRLLTGGRQMTIVLFGFLLFTGLVLLYLWSAGSFDDYVFWTLKYELGYIKVGMKMVNVLQKGVVRTLLIAAVGFVVWYSAFETIVRRKKIAVNRDALVYSILWLVFTFATVGIGGRFATRYYTQVYPPLALLAAMSIPPEWMEFKNLHSWRIAWKRWALFIPVITLWLLRFFAPLIYEAVGELDYARFQKKIGAHIRENTKKDDLIYVWGWGNGIYIYAGRYAATRFINADFLTGRVPGSHTVRDPLFDTSFNIIHGSWEMFMGDLQRDRPAYIVDTSPADIHDYAKYPIDKFPLFSEFVRNNYKLETAINDVQLYRRDAP